MSDYADLLEILHEDSHLIAINKPNGWPTTHYGGHEETLDRVVKAYLKEKYQKPGNVFLGVVHRLDKATSGTLLFARTSKAASRLSGQFREGAVEKVYWAIMPEPPRNAAAEIRKMVDQQWGTLEDWLLHDDQKQRVVTTSAGSAGAKAARLHFQVKARHEGFMLLEVRPQTGRKHQIRVQFASRGMPLYGDGKYGSPHSTRDLLGLHARGLHFLHPVGHEPISLRAEVPRWWRGRFAYLLNPGL
jgi:23S rRNA pseudouridine1911/1915/1917 synthase